MVAHPPCAQWGELSHMARVNPNEKALALLAVEFVRRFGGVLEHPKKTKLAVAARFPSPGAPADRFGGWTLMVSQKWWGHRAEKVTLLYIVGCAPRDIPPLPLVLGESEAVCGTTGRTKSMFRNQRRPEIKKSEREHTPIAFALWLCDLARRCTAIPREAAAA